MNLRNIVFSTFALSVLLSVSPKHNTVISEPSNNLNHYQKTLKAEENFNYSKAVAHSLNEGRITTRFSPVDRQGNKIELDTLASEVGYDSFSWVSYVEADPYGIANSKGKQIFAPYNDPPMGGYEYDFADKLPFYWDMVNCDRCHQRHHFENSNNLNQFELTFQDAPRDSRLQPGESIEFMTSLVGIKNIDLGRETAEWDILHTFRWKLTETSLSNGRVFIVDADVDLTQLSPALLTRMALDGAVLPSSLKVANSN